MKFTDNQQLFGFDPTPGIVAVEFADPDAVDVYLRQSDGSTEVRRETFSPFLWNASEGEELDGDLPFSHPARFLDWSSQQASRNRLLRGQNTPTCSSGTLCAARVISSGSLFPKN